MNKKMINKKSAMFGLDARIALAIFGALSVIAGAALYTAIENSKTTALFLSFQEVGKAWEQYYLDVGSLLPRVSNDSANDNYHRFITTALITKPTDVKNWKGPYLNYGNFYGDALLYSKSKDIHIYSYSLKKEGALGGANSWQSLICTSGEQCYLWLMFRNIDEAQARSFDKKYDNADGFSAGKVRYDNFKFLFYRYIPIPNTI